MSETSISFDESDHGPTFCGTGMLFLMLALACAIALGNVPLLSSSYNQYTIITWGGVILVLSAIVGGYITSKGLLFILRDSRRTDSTTQE